MAEGSSGRVRGRRGPRTTDRDHAQPIAPNRLGQRETPVERPDEAWTADITYVPADEGWLYLAGVLDPGRRRVVGWAMGESLETSLPMDALRMASRQRQPSSGLLHHSDRGCQYESRAQAAGAIFDYIETFHNRERLHSALGYLSPVEFEKQSNLN